MLWCVRGSNTNLLVCCGVSGVVAGLQGMKGVAPPPVSLDCVSRSGAMSRCSQEQRGSEFGRGAQETTSRRAETRLWGGIVL